MKLGMPIRVSPNAFTAPSAKQRGERDRRSPPSPAAATLAIVHAGVLHGEVRHHDAGRVGDAGHRQIDLGAQDDEGEPDRDDRRSPRSASGCSAGCRMWRTSRWRPRRTTTRTSSVANGAMLRSRARSQARDARRGATGDGVLARRSCRCQQPVLADRLVGEFPRPRCPSSSPRCGRRATARSPARSRRPRCRCPARAGRARSSPRRPWRRRPCRASARSAPARAADG